MFSNFNTQPMATAHVLSTTDATGVWQPSESSVTASQASSTSTMSWQTDAHQLISSGSGSQTADSAGTLASSAGAHQSSSRPPGPDASSQRHTPSQRQTSSHSEPPANNSFEMPGLDEAEELHIPQNAATQPSSRASSSETPGWIVANRSIVEERKKKGELERGPLSWMRIGPTDASSRLDVAYYDLKTCQDVPLEVTSTLDAFQRDGKRPHPKLYFKGQDSYGLVREVADEHGDTTRVYLRSLVKADLLAITLQPNERIYRLKSGTFYCEHYNKHNCGCLIAIAFSTKTCSHSIKPRGTLKGWQYETTFTHSCPDYLRTERTITNGLDGSELTLVTQVPIQVEELLKVLASARVDMYTAYNALADNGFTMDRRTFYDWYNAQLARNARGGPSMAERLAAQQKRAVAMGTTFIIKPFADRLGVASVYVQTEEMRLYLKFAAVVSIDGSRVKHGRGVLLATAKCPFGKLQIVAIAIIFGGETGDSMRALYQLLGLKGIPQVHDDGTCFDSDWLQLMVEDHVFWVLCPWHKMMEIPVSIVSWLAGEPKLADNIWNLMLTRFPEGDDDEPVERMVDYAFQNLHLYYTSDAARSIIHSVEVAKERYLLAYRSHIYLDDVNASSVPPDTALPLACASSEPGGG